jgi:flagellar M-ring protein FliF
MHWVELLVMSVLGLLVMLFVVRPLVRRVISSEQLIEQQPAVAAALAGGDVPAALAAGARVEDIKAVSNQTAKMIDIAQVQGQVHAQSVQKVGELADKNPNETVSIIRTWLHESAA